MCHFFTAMAFRYRVPPKLLQVGQFSSIAALLLLLIPSSPRAGVTQCSLSADGTSDKCCNATGQCLSGFGSLNSAATGQSSDLLVGQGILFQGTGWNPATPVQIFWDPSHIGTCTPEAGGSFNDAGTTENNTTCNNLPPCPNGPSDGTNDLCGIVPLFDPTAKNPTFDNGWGFQVESFDMVDGPCTSFVRAVQGTVEIDAELAGTPSGQVIFSKLGAKQTSIIAGGDSPAPGTISCQQASGFEIRVTPGSALVVQQVTNGAGVFANDNLISSQNVAVVHGHTLFLGLGSDTVPVTTMPAGPSPTIFDPGAACTQHLTSPIGPSDLSGVACSATDLVINGDLTLNNAILYVSGSLSVKGAVNGTGVAASTGKLIVTGAARLQTDDVFSFVSGDDMFLCGGTPGCGAATATPTPTAKPTPIPTAPPTAT